MEISNIEVEIKILLDDSAIIIDSLKAIGAKLLNNETQIDLYLDHPCKSFYRTDESLRLRHRIPYSDTEVTMLDESHEPLELTFKGPKLHSRSKTRVEISIGVSDIDKTRLMLEHLGFLIVAEIKKKRIHYELDEIIISIDNVEGLGEYIELEKIVASRSEIDSAYNEIVDIIQRLGLDPAKSISSSYMELLSDCTE